MGEKSKAALRAEIREKFFKLFDGFSLARGEAIFTGQVNQETGKVEAKCVTRRNPITEQMVDMHLEGNGQPGVGIVPLRDDGLTLYFAAIDIDDYKITVAEIIARIKELGLDKFLCVFPSKSSGAHCHVFFAVPTPAARVRKALERIAAMLGFEGCEVFPKQTHREPITGPVIGEYEGEVGNWINAPFYECRSRKRNVMDGDGNMLDIFQSLDYCLERRCTIEQLEEVLNVREAEVEDPNANEYFYGAPPCNVKMYQQGVQAGGRNNACYNQLVMFYKAGVDDLLGRLQHFNTHRVHPPLPDHELVAMVKAMEKNGPKYAYRCNEEPMASLCNKELCKIRLHGVGPGLNNLGFTFEGLTKYFDEDGNPIFYATIMGKRVQLTTDQILNQELMKKHLFEHHNMLWRGAKKERYHDHVNMLIDNVEEVAVPVEVSNKGKFKRYVEKFVEHMSQAKQLWQITTNRPYYDEANKCYIFTYEALQKHLANQQYTVKNEKVIFAYFEQLGGWSGEIEVEMVGGQLKPIKVWFLPFEQPKKDDIIQQEPEDF